MLEVEYSTPGELYSPAELTRILASVSASLDDGPTKQEITTGAAAIGAGAGASLAISSGTVTGMGWMAVLGAGAAGLVTSAYGGWEIGSAIYNIPIVQNYLSWRITMLDNAPRGDDPFFNYIDPPKFPDTEWKMNLQKDGAIREAWPTPQEGDKVTEREPYDGPIDHGGAEIIGTWGMWGLGGGQGGDAEINRFAEYA